MTCEEPCVDCLARMWLLSQLAGHLDRQPNRVADVLGIGDVELIDVIGGGARDRLLRARARLGEEEAQGLRQAAAAADLELICRHCDAYPRPLAGLAASAPATLHVAGAPVRLIGLQSAPTVAIVGTRKPSPGGLAIARELGRGLAAAGVTVVSGMALGIDSAAHEGALAAGGATIAVLPGPADRAYPASRHKLYLRIREHGVVLSEIALGSPARRWAMLARNRIIAGLAEITVVVEAEMRSGALRTLAVAGQLDRMTAAVPGAVSARHARGTNHAIAKRGAALVRGPQDVLDLLFGEGIVAVLPAQLPALDPAEEAVLRQIHGGAANVSQLGADALRGLAGLELKGWVRRGAGGSLTPRS